MKLWLDCETRSSIPLKRGIWNYADDVEVMIVTWAIDDGPVATIDLTSDTNVTELSAYAYTADEIWAHIAEFDHTVLERMDWWKRLNVPLSKWRCSATLARLHGLPGGMDKLCSILKLPEGEVKDKRGHELIMLFCVPTNDEAPWKYNDRRSHPKEWREFLCYAAQDIVSMRAIYHKLPHWNSTPRMWALWHCDQRTNERGVQFDTELATAGVKITDREKRRLAARTAKLTTNLVTGEADVESTTQRNRLLAYLADYGVDLPDLTADTVERRLEDESLPETIKELLRIRQQATKSSTAKYKRVLTLARGGRMHGMLVFCGAQRTGRWSGRMFQPHNLPRPKYEQWEIDAWITLAKHDETEMLYPDDNMGCASSALRGLIIAASGRALCVADLANIEGRDAAWIAGEDWKLDAFRAYDNLLAPDLYVQSVMRSFGKPHEWFDWEDKTAQWRQIGKVQELALQYYGGVGAFCSMADTYGLRLEQLADAAWSTIPLDVRLLAREQWNKARRRQRTYGLEERVWIVCQSLVLMWRAAHPAIVSFWFKLESAVYAAVRVPDHPIQVGRVTIDRKGAWLRILLPSGRYLCYPATGIEDSGLSFMGINPYTRQWQRLSTYSGKLFENIVQGNSADILMDGFIAAEEAGYRPVLSVHDELITEPIASPEFNDTELSRIMVSNSPWAEGLPLAAKGFTAQRYRK